MNINNIAEFIKKYDDIYNKFGHQASEEFIDQHIFVIKDLSDISLIKSYLKFISEISGDHQSYQRLCSLLNFFINKKVITESEAAKLEKTSPANRWL